MRSDDPAVIGGHRLTARLASGGTSTVYLARDGKGGHVAVKTTRAQQSDEAQARRWLRTEAAYSRRLPPFCTAPLLFDGSDQSPPFLVSEYVEGPSLAQYVQVLGPLEADQIKALAVALARAVAAVHSARLIHCDLRPGNILLASDGPRVIDFSIAQEAPVAGRVTEVGTVPYSPGWVAPERLNGRPAGPASDVFGWACLVGFAATGRSPFDGEEVEAGRPGVVRPTTLGAIEEPIRGLVEAALAVDPADRPAIGEIITRLEDRSRAQAAGAPAPLPRRNEAGVVPHAAAQAPEAGAPHSTARPEEADAAPYGAEPHKTDVVAFPVAPADDAGVVPHSGGSPSDDPTAPLPQIAPAQGQAPDREAASVQEVAPARGSAPPPPVPVTPPSVPAPLPARELAPPPAPHAVPATVEERAPLRPGSGFGAGAMVPATRPGPAAYARETETDIPAAYAPETERDIPAAGFGSRPDDGRREPHRPRRLRAVALITAPAAVVAVLATVIAMAGTGPDATSPSIPGSAPSVGQQDPQGGPPTPGRPLRRSHGPRPASASSARDDSSSPSAGLPQHRGSTRPGTSDRPARSHSPAPRPTSPKPTTHSPSPSPTPTSTGTGTGPTRVNGGSGAAD